MNIKKAASIPLILHDPYFSIWSSADQINAADTVHWSKARQKMRGYVTVDGEVYCFLGDPEFHQTIPQVSLDVTSTKTEYFFENEKLTLTLRFVSPILPEDPVLLSRPCTYLDVMASPKDGAETTIDFLLSDDFVENGAETKEKLVGDAVTFPEFQCAWMGQADQKPLSHSGDNLTIDWGYLYLASRKDEKSGTCVQYDSKNRQLTAHVNGTHASLIVAYDDLASINYFGSFRRAYWTEHYDSIYEAIGAAFEDREETLKKAAALDEDIYERAMRFGGEDYAFLCAMSFRQAVAAHKLITDEDGNWIFLSKENDSNGCIGTVDVSYPSIPLFMLYNTEYVKGMLRPVFRFASLPVWDYDFAPHDVGRYPYAWGQVYGLNPEKKGGCYSGDNGTVYPPFYSYPSGADLYDFRYQMPVEECGNMLLMTAAVCLQEGTASFAKPYWDILEGWTGYLLKYGQDPGEQLCTDDFAGHLSHNVNLSAKAILGTEAWAQLLKLNGQKDEAAEYHKKAMEMAEHWVQEADAGDHFLLAFGSPDTWSLKYNLIWDQLFDSHIFSKEVTEKELAFYPKVTLEYGTPLDSRRTWAKSDWILWAAAMTENPEIRKALIAPVAHYLQETSTRIPFGDWYDAKTGTYCSFIARSVQGGIFMPLFKEKFRNH